MASGVQRFSIDGDHTSASACNRRVDAVYFEAFPLGTTERTLRRAPALIIGR